jgi:hypothetical protein
VVCVGSGSCTVAIFSCPTSALGLGGPHFLLLACSNPNPDTLNDKCLSSKYLSQNKKRDVELLVLVLVPVLVRICECAQSSGALRDRPLHSLIFLIKERKGFWVDLKTLWPGPQRVSTRNKTSLAASSTVLSLSSSSTTSASFGLAMSGKAPPTGPRALLNSLNGCPSKRHPPQSDLSSSPHPTSSSSSSPPTPLINRIGAPPPTGPRSLLNGNTQGRTSKPTLNGHTNTNPLTGQSRQPPSGPSAMQQKPPHKGKQVEIKWSDQAIASTVSFPPIVSLCAVHSKFCFQVTQLNP